MDARERSIAAQLIERFISYTRSEADRISTDAQTDFEVRAWEEVLAGLLVAETAIARAGRCAEACAVAQDEQRTRLEERLESSLKERGIQLGVKS